MDNTILKRKMITTGIAFIIFLILCIITVVVGKTNTEKMKNPQEIKVEDLYDY